MCYKNSARAKYNIAACLYYDFQLLRIQGKIILVKNSPLSTCTLKHDLLDCMRDIDCFSDYFYLKLKMIF